MPLRLRIKEIAQTRVRYGLWRIYILLCREGWTDNYKRVYRLYKKEGLNLRSKFPRRNRAAASRLDRIEGLQLYQCWSMGFVSDALFEGRKFRTLTVVDNYSRECLVISVGQSFKRIDVVKSLKDYQFFAHASLFRLIWMNIGQTVLSNISGYLVIAIKLMTLKLHLSITRS